MCTQQLCSVATHTYTLTHLHTYTQRKMTSGGAPLGESNTKQTCHPQDPSLPPQPSFPTRLQAPPPATQMTSPASQSHQRHGTGHRLYCTYPNLCQAKPHPQPPPPLERRALTSMLFVECHNLTPSMQGNQVLRFFCSLFPIMHCCTLPSPTHHLRGQQKTKISC